MKKQAVDISVEEISSILESLVQNQTVLEDSKKSLEESIDSLEAIIHESEEQPAVEIDAKTGNY